jgi:hypothetical protein
MHRERWGNMFQAPSALNHTIRTFLDHYSKLKGNMAENAPSAAAGAVATDASRSGMPYYERLRRDLRESLQKKRMIDNNLVCSYLACI